MDTNVEHVSRYALVLAKQSSQILAQPATDATQRSDGVSLEVFRPAGAWLTAPALAQAGDAEAFVPQTSDIDALLQLTEQLAQGVMQYGTKLRLYDGLGHSRPVYVPFMVQLLQRAVQAHRETLPEEPRRILSQTLVQTTRNLALDEAFSRADTAIVLWKALCHLALHPMSEDPLSHKHDSADQAEQMIDRIIALPGRERALHTFDENEQLLDTWWFNELTGLHALTNATLLRIRPTWRDRVHGIALHHLDNIQADHVTSQPWGLAAYLQRPDTAVFGEQQMHEATTGMFSPFSKSTVLPGLLMADASLTLHQWAISSRHETG